MNVSSPASETRSLCFTLDRLRGNCRGEVPLPGRVATWMQQILNDPRTHGWLAEQGSPLNIINPEEFNLNASALTRTASSRGLRFRPFFARKANKCLAFVDAALASQLGLDCASEDELRQSLDRGATGSDLICTAAVKDKALMTLCLASGATIAIDNMDELVSVEALVGDSARAISLALRISGFTHQGKKLPSRFGFDIDAFPELLHYLTNRPTKSGSITGLHFHLDGYSRFERIAAIEQLLPLADALRDAGEPVSFIDIGGGLPVSYLNDREDWSFFWTEHERALIGLRSEITYRNNPLGRMVDGDRVLGNPVAYPFFQEPTRDAWLASILDYKCDGPTIARQLASRHLELRCEPGRSLLDNAGMTLVRVEATKTMADRNRAVLLAMNGTQCRTSSADFFVDPILVRALDRDSKVPVEAAERGYLFGAYCTESDLVVKRRLVFPQGVGAGDFVALPNTAGYFMHFLESRSHQLPLARNLIYDPTLTHPLSVDPIDATDETPSTHSP